MPPPDSLEPPHKYCESTNTVFSQDVFAMVLKTGGESSVFIFQPNHMKQLARRLMEKVEAYEKQFGPLSGRLPNEPLKSPIQLDRRDDIIM